MKCRKIKTIGIILFFIITLLPVISNATPLLKWEASSGEVTGYKIYYGTASGTYSQNKDAGNVLQYSLPNLSLTAGVTYYFVVRAYNSAGESGNSNEVVWTPGDQTPPMPPLNLNCPSGSSTITWSKGTEADLKEYRVYYGTSSGHYNPFIPVGNVVSYKIDALQEGVTYYIAITAVDNAGNESSYSNEVSTNVADNVLPLVTVTSPTSGTSYSTASAGITISGTASDNVGVTQVTWENSKGGNGTAIGTATWTAEGIALSPGSNIITIRASDGSGNVASRTLTVNYSALDTAAPSISITSPAAGGSFTTNSSSISLSGSASDDRGVTKVSWTNVQGGNDIAAGTTIWSAQGISLVEGVNEIVATAYDAAGNSGTATIVVTYKAPDTSSPVLSITSPSEVGIYKTTSHIIDIYGTASDNVGVLKVTWNCSPGQSGVASGADKWSVSNMGLSEGENLVTVTAWDAAGNSSSKALTINYTPPDTQAPEVSVSLPASGGTYSTTSSTINIAGSASDNAGVTKVTWQNSTGGSGIAAGTEKWGVSGISLKEGDNIITIVAYDGAGNQGKATLTINYALGDKIPPTLTRTKPTSGRYYFTRKTSVDLAGMANDNSGIASVEWKNSKGGQGTASGTDKWSISGIKLVGGWNVIKVTATDNAGNKTTNSLYIICWSF